MAIIVGIRFCCYNECFLCVTLLCAENSSPSFISTHSNVWIFCVDIFCASSRNGLLFTFLDLEMMELLLFHWSDFFPFFRQNDDKSNYIYMKLPLSPTPNNVQSKPAKNRSRKSETKWCWEATAMHFTWVASESRQKIRCVKLMANTEKWTHQTSSSSCRRRWQRWRQADNLCYLFKINQCCYVFYSLSICLHLIARFWRMGEITYNLPDLCVVASQ